MLATMMIQPDVQVSVGEGGSDPVTTILAVWGAVVSTLVAAWTIYRDWTDRPKVKLVVYLADVMSPGGRQGPYLVYHVTNVGRRPVTITLAGGRMKDNPRAFLINSPELPKKLDPHEGVHLQTHDLQRLTEVATFTVTDSLGKEWPATRDSHRRLQEDLEELVEVD